MERMWTTDRGEAHVHKRFNIYIVLPIPNLRASIPLPAQANLHVIPAKGRATYVPSLENQEW